MRSQAPSASSRRFSGCFDDSTLPPEVIAAIAANLTILKSPTVMHQADGKFWGGEGGADGGGCCHGYGTTGVKRGKPFFGVKAGTIDCREIKLVVREQASRAAQQPERGFPEPQPVASPLDAGWRSSLWI